MTAALAYERCPKCARLGYDSDCSSCLGEGRIQFRDRGPDRLPAPECECGAVGDLSDGLCRECWSRIEAPWPDEPDDPWA